jgi:hypothetical protein
MERSTSRSQADYEPPLQSRRAASFLSSSCRQTVASAWSRCCPWWSAWIGPFGPVGPAMRRRTVVRRRREKRAALRSTIRAHRRTWVARRGAVGDPKGEVEAHSFGRPSTEPDRSGHRGLRLARAHPPPCWSAPFRALFGAQGWSADLPGGAFGRRGASSTRPRRGLAARALVPGGRCRMAVVFRVASELARVGIEPTRRVVAGT